jgi:DNA-binding response OmpR family regulator
MTNNQVTDTQLKILVVDDDAFFRQLLNRILTAVGYHVIETRSVADAINALEQAPDLAIIDYRMPGSDGASFIKELREKNYKFPIVFCSGSGMDQKTFASMRNVYHVDMIVQKPIHPETFIQQIGELLYERQNERQSKANSQNQASPEPEAETDAVAEAELNQYAAIEAEETEEQVQEPILNEHNQTLDEFLRQENLLPEAGASTVAKADEEAAQAMRETEEAIAELGSIYLLELPNELEQMTIEIVAAASKNDTSALSQATNRAHQIKGTAGSLGFDTLSQIGAVLEKQLLTLGQEELNCQDYRWTEIQATLEQASTWIEQKVKELDSGKPIESAIKVVPELSGSMIVETINLDQNTHSQPQGRLLPPRVLVVASDRALISNLTNALEEERLTVKSITSSMEAFSVLDDFQPELIMLQETMPSVSGNDICRMIRCNSRWQTIPILILADITSCTVESRQKVFEAGASDFVLTPLAALELKAKLKNYLPLVKIQNQPLTF